jgi:hypothetical protein
MRSLIGSRRAHEAIAVIVLAIMALLCSRVHSQTSQRAALSMDAQYLVLPRAGFHELERFPDQSRVFRWTRESSWLGLPNPGGPATLRLIMVGGPGGPTPVRMQVGASKFNLTVQPELRRYTLPLHETKRERLSLTMEAPVIAVGERSLGIMVSDLEVSGTPVMPDWLVFALLLAAIGGYMLLRQVSCPILPAAGSMLSLELIVLFWQLLSGWRYGLTSPLLLLLGGTALAAVVLEWSSGYAARAASIHTTRSPITLRAIGVLLAAVCVFLPWLSVAELFPPWLAFSLTIATVGGYLQLRRWGWRVLPAAAGILTLGLLALIWHTSNMRGADLVGPALMVLGAASLLGSVLQRKHVDLLMRSKPAIASICFLLITIAALILHISLWGADKSKQDIYYIWSDGNRIVSGENPYERILSGDMRLNDKYATYFPLFYLLGALTNIIGFASFSDWIVVWQYIFLVFNAGIAFILYYTLYKSDFAFLAICASALWLYNRWTLYISMTAQIDFIPIFFLLLSVVVFNKRMWLSLLLLSCSLAVKQIAIFVVPIYLICIWHLTAGKSKRDMAIAIITIFSVPLLASIPFIFWNAEGFIRSVLFSVTRDSEVFFGAASADQVIRKALPDFVGFLTRIPLLVLMFLVYIGIVQKKFGIYIGTLLIMVIFVNVNAVVYNQYMAWIIPFVPLVVSEIRYKSYRVGQAWRN